MRLTPRDVALVTLVAERNALIRRQISTSLQFGSITRVNAVLSRLVSHGYLDRRWQPTLSGTRRAVYIVGRRGRELLGNTSNAKLNRFKVASDLFLEHLLVINDVWVSFATLAQSGYRLTRWTDEGTLREASLSLVPDAYLEYDLDGQSFAAFVEADLGTETLRRWQDKTRGYLHLAFSGQFEQVFARRFFRALVVTSSERRLNNLRVEVARHTDRIFWFTTRERLAASGPLALIWSRPKDATLQSLTSP